MQRLGHRAQRFAQTIETAQRASHAGRHVIELDVDEDDQVEVLLALEEWVGGEAAGPGGGAARTGLAAAGPRFAAGMVAIARLGGGAVFCENTTGARS